MAKKVMIDREEVLHDLDLAIALATDQIEPFAQKILEGTKDIISKIQQINVEYDDVSLEGKITAGNTVLIRRKDGNIICATCGYNHTNSNLTMTYACPGCESIIRKTVDEDEYEREKQNNS